MSHRRRGFSMSPRAMCAGTRRSGGTWSTSSSRRCTCRRLWVRAPTACQWRMQLLLRHRPRRRPLPRRSSPLHCSLRRRVRGPPLRYRDAQRAGDARDVDRAATECTGRAPLPCVVAVGVGHPVGDGHPGLLEAPFDEPGDRGTRGRCTGQRAPGSAFQSTSSQSSSPPLVKARGMDRSMTREPSPLRPRSVPRCAS